jgi:hypothetical protein
MMLRRPDRLTKLLLLSAMLGFAVSLTVLVILVASSPISSSVSDEAELELAGSVGVGSLSRRRPAESISSRRTMQRLGSLLNSLPRCDSVRPTSLSEMT